MRLASRLRSSVTDAWVLALFAVAELDALFANRPGSTLAQVTFAAAWTLPLLFRRRWAAGAALIALAALTVEAHVAYAATESQVVLVTVVLAFFTIGRHEEPSRALVAGLLGAVLGWLLLAADSGPVTAGSFVFLGIVCATPVAAGMVLRARERETVELTSETQRLEREQDERAREAVADERARIARELHDMIGHAISVITIQAGAARLQLDGDPERAREPLLAIEETGHETLAEMRRLIGMLRDMGEPGLAPQPGLAQLDRLVEGVRSSGLPVELRREGDRSAPLPSAVDLAAYRIVQEALTNVLKHGGRGRAIVTVRYALRSLGLEVQSLHSGRRNSTGNGRGLVGMQERVEQCGGELHAGDTPDGGYAVCATLPLTLPPS